MKLMGEPTLLWPPPSPLTSISIAPLLTIGMVTSWIVKIRRKELYDCLVGAGGESQQRTEAKGWSGKGSH